MGVNNLARALGHGSPVVSPALGTVLAPVRLTLCAEQLARGVTAIRSGKPVVGTLTLGSAALRGLGTSARIAASLAGPVGMAVLGPVAVVTSSLGATLMGAREVYTGVRSSDAECTKRGCVRIIAGGLLASGGLLGVPLMTAGGAFTFLGLLIQQDRARSKVDRSELEVGPEVQTS